MLREQIQKRLRSFLFITAFDLGERRAISAPAPLRKFDPGLRIGTRIGAFYKSLRRPKRPSSLSYSLGV
jgi:hypothetical protein